MVNLGVHSNDWIGVGEGQSDARQLFQNAAQIAAGLIREAIYDGRIPQGTRLREEKLAAEFGLSRTPIREALLILQTEGFLVAAPNRGAMVKTYSTDEIIDLYDTRAALEGFAASVAVKYMTSESIIALDESCERFAKSVKSNNVLALTHENSTFHKTILEATHNTSLRDVVGSVARLPLIYRAYYWYSDQGKLIALHYHEQITRALDSRDSTRVEALMREHIYEARDTLVAQMRMAERDVTIGKGALDLATALANRSADHSSNESHPS
ncbi:MAG: GntR family transcriptional regulator [Acidimicrobiales bacterium]